MEPVYLQGFKVCSAGYITCTVQHPIMWCSKQDISTKTLVFSIYVLTPKSEIYSAAESV